MTMITPSYLGETIEYSSLHACRSTLEDPTHNRRLNNVTRATPPRSCRRGSERRDQNGPFIKWLCATIRQEGHF